MKIRPKLSTRKRSATDPVYHVIVVEGAGDAIPDPCTLKHRDWVCWVNPKRPGTKAFNIKFAATNPLKDVRGRSLADRAVLKVNTDAPTGWYQLKRSVKKGVHFHYKLTVRKGGPHQPPGPEIISGD